MNWTFKLVVGLVFGIECLGGGASVAEEDPLSISKGMITFSYTKDLPGTGFRHSEFGLLRREAFGRAVEKWSKVLLLPQPVKLNVAFRDITAPTLAVGGASSSYQSVYHPWPNAGYPSALSSQLRFKPVIPDKVVGENADLALNVHGFVKFANRIAFNEEGGGTIPGESVFYYGEDPTGIKYNEQDFESVAIHEIAHALGVLSYIRKDGSYEFWPSAYDYNLYYPFAGWIGGASVIVHSSRVWDGVRKAAITSEDFLFWGGEFGNALARLQSGISCIDPLYELMLVQAEGVSPGHLEQSCTSVMGPRRTPGMCERTLDVVPGLLADLGYWVRLNPIVEISNWAPDGDEPGLPLDKSNGGDLHLLVKNFGPLPLDVGISVADAGHGDAFELTSASEFSVNPWEDSVVAIGFMPPQGIRRVFIGQVHVISNDPAQEYLQVPIAQYLAMTDTDDDGLTDEAETFDFDEGGGFYNPFDPEDSDSTGDDGATTSDGILDGFNDFDDDGVSNMAEFDLGYDPLDPGDYPIMDDTDGDGLSDYDELRDLDFSTEGIQNPLDPWRYDGDEDGILDGDEDYDGDGIPNAVELTHPTIFDVLQEDVTGDDGAFGPDTILDGENDFDDDGISNADEVRYGLDVVVFTAIGDIQWQLCVLE